jgi:FSR family fosmidomycin resistance protein-like MFS transporter
LEEAESNTQDQFHGGDVLTIAAAHGLNDTYAAFLPSFLPVFIENLALSKTQAGALSAYGQLPSLAQPVIGLLADRRGLRWVVILAPAVTAVAGSLLGVMPSTLFIALLLTLIGFSSAGIHAVGPAIAGKLSSGKLGKGMSYWMVAGELGRALGPLVAVTAIQYLGLSNTPWLSIAGLIVSVFLYFRLRRLPHDAHAPSQYFEWKPALRSMAPFMAGIAIVIVTGFFLSSGITTFLPTYLTEKGTSLWLAGASLTLYELAGVAGIMVVGPISDRVGRKPVLIGAFLLTPPVTLLFLFSSSWLQSIGLILMGFGMLSINPVLMAWIQERFPDYRAFANGIYMAMNFVFRSVIVVIIGWIGDTWGLQASFLISAGLMLLAIPVISLMPETHSPSAAGTQTHPG